MSSRPLLSLLVVLGLGCGGSVTEGGEPPPGDGATGGDSSTTNDGTTGTDSSTGTDSTTGTDTSTGTDGSTGGGIKCGTAMCNPATEECCVGFSSKCVPKGTCAGGSPLSCSDSSVCAPGEVCCAGGSGGSLSAKCAPSASCAGRILCSKDSECPDGQKCLDAFGGYKMCRRPGGPGTDGGFGDGGFPPPPSDGATPG